MLKGIDISAWQKDVDFNKVKADGIQFCLFRGGYGNSRDTEFLKHVKGAQAAGIPILGVYHFVYINSTTARQNALRHIQNVKSAGLDPATTWMYCDVEYDTFTQLKRPATRSECTRIVKEFMETLTANGCRKIGIYTNADYYLHYLDWTVLKPYRANLWLADLNGGPDYECGIQQYSFTGKVAGIAGNVDLNYLRDPGMLKSSYLAMTTASLNCRQTPGGTILKSYPEWELLTIHHESNNWGYTGEGWVSLDYISSLEGYTEMNIKDMIKSEVKAEFDRRDKERQSTAVASYFTKELNEAKAKGITDGTRPNDYATRTEAAIMALRGGKK